MEALIFSSAPHPIAPFTVVNIVAGVSRIRFYDFIIGATIRLLPGLLGMSLFEASLKTALMDPGTEAQQYVHS